MISFACLVPDFKTGLELSGILSRSNLPVCLRTQIPEGDNTAAKRTPFEVLVINDPVAKHTSPLNNRISQLLNFLHQRNTFRYGLIFPRSVAELSLEERHQISDTLIKELANFGIEEVCQFTHWPLNDHLASSTLPYSVIQADALEYPAAELSAIINESLGDSTAQVLVPFNAESDWLKLTRATEQAACLIGTSQLVEHIPALLRIRGWLSNNDQLKPLTIDEPAPLHVIGKPTAQTQLLIESLAPYASQVQTNNKIQPNSVNTIDHESDAANYFVEQLKTKRANLNLLTIGDSLFPACLSVISPCDVEPGAMIIKPAVLNHKHPLARHLGMLDPES